MCAIQLSRNDPGTTADIDKMSVPLTDILKHCQRRKAERQKRQAWCVSMLRIDGRGIESVTSMKQ